MPASETPAVITGKNGWAVLDGSIREPQLHLHFHFNAMHLVHPRTPLKDWVRTLTSAHWDPSQQAWTVSGMNSLTPTTDLMDAGLSLNWDARPAEFADVETLDELAIPIAKLAMNGRTVLVRPRLAGHDGARKLLGGGAVWDGDRRIFRTPTFDVLTNRDGQLYVREGIHWPTEAVKLAIKEHTAVPVIPELAHAAAALGSAKSMDELTPDQREMLTKRFGPLPTGGRAPFAYQEAGAYAIAAGRTCLFDEPGVGKTAGALLAARLLNTQRAIMVVPPLLTTNWRREIAMSGLFTDEQVVTFKPGKKEPALPEAGAVIIADSLLAARPDTLQKLIGWSADVLIVDEAHRSKTIGSKRSEAVLDLAGSIRHAPIALTGTPLFASPNELVNILELTRQLAPVFGGRAQFLEDFCYQDRFGGWRPRKLALSRLRSTLQNDVWVRRRKKDILPQLPPKLRESIPLDVPLKEYRDAHKVVIAKIHGWITWFTEQQGRRPTNEELADWSQASTIGLISQLRQAAGLAKVPAALELIEDHLNGTGFDGEGDERTYERPLTVWVHHKPVALSLLEELRKQWPNVGLISGQTSDSERDRQVDAFQDGKIPVLICSITAAGFGLTLTRGSDTIFAETDWTPAMIKQSEDRHHRPGATAEALHIRTLVARGTLDEVIQRVLGRKVEILESAIGDVGDSVAFKDDSRGLREIIEELVAEAMRTYKGPA